MNQATSQPATSETNTRKEIGAQMAALRQQFNLTQQEVSERLHIRTRYVSAIEEGRYDLMPGKVYARGYVHTYAEFLGLNPEQVVSQCFAGELPANAQPISNPQAARAYAVRANTISPSGGQWRGYIVLGAIALVVLIVISQFTGRGDDVQQQEASVAPVPEDILASVRNMVMPLPNNYLCLTTDNAFECFSADNTTRMLNRLQIDGLHYGGKVDVSSLLLSLPEAVEEEAAVPAAEEPAAETPSDAAPAEAEPAND